MYEPLPFSLIFLIILPSYFFRIIINPTIILKMSLAPPENFMIPSCLISAHLFKISSYTGQWACPQEYSIYFNRGVHHWGCIFILYLIRLNKFLSFENAFYLVFCLLIRTVVIGRVFIKPNKIK